MFIATSYLNINAVHFSYLPWCTWFLAWDLPYWPFLIIFSLLYSVWNTLTELTESKNNQTLLFIRSLALMASRAFFVVLVVITQNVSRHIFRVPCLHVAYRYHAPLYVFAKLSLFFILFPFIITLLCIAFMFKLNTFQRMSCLFCTSIPVPRNFYWLPGRQAFIWHCTFRSFC